MKIHMRMFVGLGLVLSAAVRAGYVTVGNPGNAADSTTYGGVAYEYQINQFEVTAGEYTAFLNAVAASDPNGLYNAGMDTSVSAAGCNIIRSGSDGSYTYSVAGDWAVRPVNYVSWYDAVRYANWLHNGQPTGAQDGTTTEDGSYDMSPATITRDVGATYVLPTEDEWYKAAYHKNDGVTGNYWLYPTGSDSAPGYVNDSGNLSGGGAFNEGGGDPGGYATYSGDGGTAGIGSPYYRTNVGEWENSASPYGTFDQGGNVLEWNETPISANRSVRGGSVYGSGTDLQPVTRYYSDPTLEYNDVGFRVASLTSVPEPTSLVLLALAGLGMVARRRRVA